MIDHRKQFDGEMSDHLPVKPVCREDDRSSPHQTVSDDRSSPRETNSEERSSPRQTVSDDRSSPREINSFERSSPRQNDVDSRALPDCTYIICILSLHNIKIPSLSFLKTSILFCIKTY